MKNVQIAGLPAALEWDVPPVAWTVGAPGALTITAGAVTDLFNNPNGEPPKRDSARLMFAPEPGDFTLSAKVHVDFRSTFDAGVLLIWEDVGSWGKLCFEFSPQAEPMIVSVVTRGGLSDDGNAVVMPSYDAWLRIARVGTTFALHYAADGQWWHMVRYFALAHPERVRIGLSSQSPTGQGCSATFSEVRYERRTLTNLRDGS